MDWPHGWGVIAATAMLAGLAGSAGSWRAALRRRRLHLALIQEAVTDMSARLDQAPPPTARLRRDLTETLVRQQDRAERIERELRPRVPAAPAAYPAVAAALKAVIDTLGGTVDRPSAGAGPRAAGAADGARRPGAPSRPQITGRRPQLGARHRSALRPDASGTPLGHGAPPRGPGALGPVPAPDGDPELAELYQAMAATAATRLRHTDTLIRLALRQGLLGAGTGERLTAATGAAADALRESRSLAREGRHAAALHALTQADLPVSEDRMPGAATARDLARQAELLRAAAADHRHALLAWCADALSRCGAPAAEGSGR